MADVIINLTPHPVALYGSRGTAEGPEEVIPPSGNIARVSHIELGTGVSGRSGRSFEWVEYGHVDQLPQPQPETDYIVSLVVALACHRDDLLAPYGEVRNAEGTVIGCRFLQRVC